MLMDCGCGLCCMLMDWLWVILYTDGCGCGLCCMLMDCGCGLCCMLMDCGWGLFCILMAVVVGYALC